MAAHAAAGLLSEEGADPDQRLAVPRYHSAARGGGDAAHTQSTETRTRLQQRVAPHQRRGYTRLVVVWDQVSWHGAHTVRPALRAPNRSVNQVRAGGTIVAVVLPVHACGRHSVAAIMGLPIRTGLPCGRCETVEQQGAVIDRLLLYRHLRKVSVRKGGDLGTEWR